jgi:hypothetical protein
VQVDDDILLAITDDYEEAALVLLGGITDEGRDARVTMLNQQEGGRNDRIWNGRT